MRSAYKVLVQEQRRHSVRGGQESSSGGNMQAEHWKGIWALKCRGKIKNFLWRLAHDSLAMRMNLKWRRMEPRILISAKFHRNFRIIVFIDGCRKKPYAGQKFQPKFGHPPKSGATKAKMVFLAASPPYKTPQTLNSLDFSPKFPNWQLRSFPTPSHRAVT